MLIADVFDELGDTAKAKELYELAAEVLEAIPSRYLIEVYQKLAALLEADGRKDEALGVLKKAVAVQSQPPGRAASSLLRVRRPFQYRCRKEDCDQQHRSLRPRKTSFGCDRSLRRRLSRS